MKQIIFLLALSAFIFSCKKEKKEEDTTPDKTSLITGKWKSVGYYIYSSSTLTTTYDTLELNTNGTGSWHKIPIFNYPVTWYFINNQEGFHMTLTGNPNPNSDNTIKKLDGTDFWFTPDNYKEYRFTKIP